MELGLVLAKQIANVKIYEAVLNKQNKTHLLFFVVAANSNHYFNLSERHVDLDLGFYVSLFCENVFGICIARNEVP